LCLFCSLYFFLFFAHRDRQIVDSIAVAVAIAESRQLTLMLLFLWIALW
jgi:hypothetical protein